MRKLAIDIALLLPSDVARRAIEVNRALLTGAADEFALDEVKVKPHVSLAQGIVDSSSVPAIQEILNRVGREFSALELRMTGVHHGERKKGRDWRVMPSWKVEKTQALLKLHAAVNAAMQELWVQRAPVPAVPEWFENPSEINKGTLDIVGWFERTRDSTTFNPHITLGVGVAPELDAPFTFTADNLTACRLGNFCTCRTILAQATLPPRGVIG